MDASIIQKIKQSMRGPVLCAGDNAYDEARVIFNGMIDKRPGVIIQCSGAADVIDAVNIAREHKLLVAVRGGGHGVAGNAVCDGEDSLMIDLSLMNAVRVDPEAQVAWVQGGALLGDVDRETQAFGLVAPAGVVSATGVAGLTLGGGFGWVRGKYGMTIDNLLSVDIVTADGRLLHASEDKNPDLFWAVRGGGGNFGIVTTFKFRLHPLGPEVMFCAPMYAAEQATEVLRAWRAFMNNAPDEFTTEFFFWEIPFNPNFPTKLHGKNVVVPAGVYAGPVEEGRKLVQPLRELGGKLHDLSGPMLFTTVQQTFDEYMPRGAMQSYWKSLYLNGMSDELIDLLVRILADRPARKVPFVIQDLRGVSTRVPAEATAFGDRSMPYMLELNSSWLDSAENESNIAWTRDVWNQLSRFSSGTGYLNMSCYNEDGETAVQNTFKSNYDRLREIKRKYDPNNLFRLNANILPA